MQNAMRIGVIVSIVVLAGLKLPGHAAEPIYRPSRSSFDSIRAAHKPDEATANRQQTLRQASHFAQTLLHARRLIDENYIRPSRGTPALKSALQVIFEKASEPIPDDISQRIERLDELRGLDTARLLEDTRLRIEGRNNLSGHQPLETCLNEMADSLDEYSAYIPPPAWAEMQAESEGGFVGIGVRLRELPGTKTTVVETTIVGSPAFQAGLRAQDRIVEVDGTDTTNLGMDMTARLLSGPEGKRVHIGVQRPGETTIQRISFVRRKVRVESVLGRRRRPDFTWDYWLHQPSGIAYVRITSFAEETADDLLKVLQEYRAKGLRALVLDLRFNPGGLLDSAIDVADCFLSDGLIVSIRDRQGTEVRKVARKPSDFEDLPLVVLVNRFSASGSEIVAAAIADHRRGTIIGERTFGKGSIQNLHPLEEGKSVLKLTTATFHRPNGENLNRFPDSTPNDPWGVQPPKGMQIEMSAEQVELLRSNLMQQEIIARPDEAPVLLQYSDEALERALMYLQ